MSLEEKRENQSDVKTNYHFIDHKKKFLVILKIFKSLSSDSKNKFSLKLKTRRTKTAGTEKYE